MLKSIVTDPCFSPSIYDPRASRLGHKWMGENAGRNLQYGPRTRLVRGMFPAWIHLMKMFPDRVAFRLKQGQVTINQPMRIVLEQEKLRKYNNHFCLLYIRSFSCSKYDSYWLRGLVITWPCLNSSNVRFVNKSHYFEPIRLQGLPLISKWM